MSYEERSNGRGFARGLLVCAPEKPDGPLFVLRGDKEVVPVSFAAFVRWAAGRKQPWRVRRTVWPTGELSTIFTGMRLMPGEPPRVFETMGFDLAIGAARWFWSSWSEAERGHLALAAALAVPLGEPQVEEIGWNFWKARR